ncbi:MAG: nucleotidyltransferase domain-containing protein [Methanosarcinaceae archaeon]|nr:nucleotidyltransferase domain-containing protein [Methanosarcinaceae archaeon]
MLKTRLRDFLLTEDDWLFAVVDYFHKDGIRSTLRYVPDENGDRELNGIRYRKYDFGPAFEFMREHRPDWVRDVHVVPETAVKKLLRPSDRIPELVKTDSRVAEIVKILDKAGISRSSMGVTGSMVAGLQNEKSDIDFLVYGPAWFKARDAIAAAKKEEGPIEDIDEEMWQRIYTKRIPEISFDEFMLHEARKGNRGMVDGTYFDLLFTREWDQIKAPLQRGTDTVKLKIEAEVTNADFAFDNPSYYKIDHEEIDHVLSYTHTYAGQALPGEIIEARGVVEEVGNMKRLVVGTSREPKGEWIRSLSWLEKCGQI